MISAGVPSIVRDTAWVAVDYWHYEDLFPTLGEMHAAESTGAKAPVRDNIFGAGSICLIRGTSGAWHGVVYYEAEMGEANPGPQPCRPRGGQAGHN